MASFKLYYKIGIIGALINNLLFSVIGIIGVELSRRKKEIGLTTMAVISVAGIIAYPGIFIIGYIVILVAVFLGLFEKKH